MINETRVGRPLGDSLDDTAARMASKDFTWVAQAIAIHREVGGDLAEVLDTVGQTIRERNQIRRQVKALSAEGRMSGYRADAAAVRRHRLPDADQSGLSDQAHPERRSAGA